MKKDKPIIVEYRYTGDLPFPSWKRWNRYKAYRDTKTAQMVVDSMNPKRRHFEYRIKPDGFQTESSQK